MYFVLCIIIVLAVWIVVAEHEQDGVLGFLAALITSLLLLLISVPVMVYNDVTTQVKWQDKVTKYERIIFDATLSVNNCEDEIYKLTEITILKRQAKPEEEDSFKDLKEAIAVDNKKTCRGKPLVTVDQVIAGIKRMSSEDRTVPQPEHKPETPVVVQPVEVVNIPKKDNVLTPAMYDEMIVAVKTCNRAKVKLLGLTEEKDYLTSEDYNVVMGQVMRCKAFELETELNK